MAYYDKNKAWFDKWGPRVVGKAYGGFRRFAEATAPIRRIYKGGDVTQDVLSRMGGRSRGKAAVARVAKRYRSGVVKRPSKKRFVKRTFPGRARDRVGRHQFYTMGKYAGSFSAPRNVRGRDLFRTLGSTTKVEVQASTAGADTAEIGHSVCVPQLIMQSVGRAILRRGLEKIGHQPITDWSATVGGTNSVDYTYQIIHRTDPTTSTVTSPTATNFGSSLTYSGMADELMEAILALYTTTNDHVMIEHINFSRQFGASTDPYDEFTLPVRQSVVCVSVLSLMTLQNITESSSGGTDDHTQTTDVRANPVIGRMFQTLSNSFIPVAGSTDGFTSNVATSRHGQLGDTTGNMSHPKPPNFYQNARRSGQVILQPGEIKKSKLSKTVKVGFNKLMRMFWRWLQVNTSVTSAATDAYIGFGPSRMYHFEHMVKNSSDPSVTLGYELNIFVKSYLKYWKRREALRIEE